MQIVVLFCIGNGCETVDWMVRDNRTNIMICIDKFNSQITFEGFGLWRKKNWSSILTWRR